VGSQSEARRARSERARAARCGVAVGGQALAAQQRTDNGPTGAALGRRGGAIVQPLLNFFLASSLNSGGRDSNLRLLISSFFTSCYLKQYLTTKHELGFVLCNRPTKV
jgi:hypothetical protein